MYRVVLVCDAVPKHAGEATAREITEEFKHRPWYVNATCIWNGSQLVFQADNDFDSNGLTLLDEFSGVIAAYSGEACDGDLRIVSVTGIDAG